MDSKNNYDPHEPFLFSRTKFVAKPHKKFLKSIVKLMQISLHSMIHDQTGLNTNFAPSVSLQSVLFKRINPTHTESCRYKQNNIAHVFWPALSLSCAWRHEEPSNRACLCAYTHMHFAIRRMMERPTIASPFTRTRCESRLASALFANATSLVLVCR